MQGEDTSEGKKVPINSYEEVPRSDPEHSSDSNGSIEFYNESFPVDTENSRSEDFITPSYPGIGSAEKGSLCVSYTINPIGNDVKFFINARVKTHLNSKGQGDHITAVNTVIDMFTSIFNYNNYNQIEDKINLLLKLILANDEDEAKIINREAKPHESETREKVVRILKTLPKEYEDKITLSEINIIEKELIHAKLSYHAYYLAKNTSEFIKELNKSKYSTSFNTGRILKNPGEGALVRDTNLYISSIEFISYLSNIGYKNTSEYKTYKSFFSGGNVLNGLPKLKIEANLLTALDNIFTSIEKPSTKESNRDSDTEESKITEEFESSTSNEGSEENTVVTEGSESSEETTKEIIKNELNEIMKFVLANYTENIRKSINDLYDFKRLLYFSIEDRKSLDPLEKQCDTEIKSIDTFFQEKIKTDSSSAVLYENHPKINTHETHTETIKGEKVEKKIKTHNKRISVKFLAERTDKKFFIKTLTNHLTFMYFSLENFFSYRPNDTFKVFEDFIYDLLIEEDWIGIFKDENELSNFLNSVTDSLDKVSNSQYKELTQGITKNLADKVLHEKIFHLRDACNTLEDQLWVIIKKNTNIKSVNFDFKKNDNLTLRFRAKKNRIRIGDKITKYLDGNLKENLTIKYNSHDLTIPFKNIHSFYNKHVKTSRLNSDFPATTKYHGLFKINKSKKELYSDTVNVNTITEPYVECICQ